MTAGEREQASPIEVLLEAVGRVPGQATRLPRAAIDAVVRRLFDSAVTALQGSEPGGQDRLRIDDLARVSGVSTRNIRAYRERGLLSAPRKSGRVVFYDETHVARLGTITSLLERGYSMAHIGELLAAWESGQDLAGLLGVELVRPWAADRPAMMPLAQVRELAGDAAGFERLVAGRLVDVRGDEVLVQRPSLLQAFAETRGYGMPMQAILEVNERVQPLLDQIASILVEAGGANVVAPLLAASDDVLDEQRMSELVAMLVRIRTLASDSVRAGIDAAIERRIETAVGDHIDGLVARRNAQQEPAR